MAFGVWIVFTYVAVVKIDAKHLGLPTGMMPDLTHQPSEDAPSPP